MKPGSQFEILKLIPKLPLLCLRWSYSTLLESQNNKVINYYVIKS